MFNQLVRRAGISFFEGKSRFWNVLSSNLHSRARECCYPVITQLSASYWDHTINKCPLQKMHIHHMQTKLTVTYLRNMISVLMQSRWSTLCAREGKELSNLAVVRVLGDTPRTLKMGEEDCESSLGLSRICCRHLLCVSLLTLFYSKNPPPMKKGCVLSPRYITHYFWHCTVQKLLQICGLYVLHWSFTLISQDLNFKVHFQLVGKYIF